MSSQQRGIKRPRTDPAPVDKKSIKKHKGKGKKKSPSISNDAAGPALESTATPEGHMMAQALSTFNALELSRFEAFRRSTFRGDAISGYVAFCLAEHQERRYAAREGTRRLVGGAGLGVVAPSGRTAAALRRNPHVVDYRPAAAGAAAAATAGTGGGGAGGQDVTTEAEASAAEVPRLEDLVAPNTAQEITVVVSALAKCYAQRLVTAARRVASAEGHPDGARLLPRHILEAHRHRSMAGVDPGFFLQPPPHAQRLRGMGSGPYCGPAGGGGGVSSACAAALGVADKNRLKYAAALQAQEEYDRLVAEEEKKEDEEE